METTKRNVTPAIPGMNQGDEEKGKVSKGAAIGTAVGVGVAAAAGGTAAGATVISDALNKKHYDLDDDDDEELNDDTQGDDNEDDGYYDDDKDLDRDDKMPPERRGREQRDDVNRRETENRRNDEERNVPPRNNNNDNNDGNDIDDRTDTIIENDQIDVDVKEDEWSPVGWRTIADQDGNEVTGMLFEDGNGGYVLITEGEPGSGIYDLAMNPDTGESLPINEQFAYTRGDLEAMVDTEGGYIAPGAEDRMFAENDDINPDIIVTDDGELVAQSDRNGGDDVYSANNEGIIYEDDLIDGPVDEDIIITDDQIAMTDDEIIMEDQTDIIIEDDQIAMTDDDIIMDDDSDIIVDDEQLAMVDEEVIVNDEELEPYLGDDDVAEVNEEPVEFVDDSQEMVAENSAYVPDEAYDDPMDADIYDDPGVDMV